ncbi:MAG: PAS domain-containing protein [Bacteroidales bacterium]|nr:PAS domain-containing protein [Bacteroidales bacterium]
MKLTKIELKKQLDFFKNENRELKDKIAEQIYKIYFYEQAFNIGKTLFYTAKIESQDILKVSNPHYFKELLGYEFNHTPELNPLNYLEAAHPDDRQLQEQKKIFLSKNIYNCLSSLYRIIMKDGKYKWFYSKICPCDKDKKGVFRKYFGMITEFDNNLFSQTQVCELNKEIKRNNSNNDCDLLTDEEIMIIKLLANGNKIKEAASILGMGISTFNRRKKFIFIKTKTKNTTSLIKYFNESGLG